MKTKYLIALLIMYFAMSVEGYAQNYSIGVYYYPGWRSDYINWKDLKGSPGSQSPGKAWPDREPLLGHYPEEKPWVAEKHIEWAAEYGINFFAYDWYWDGKKPEYDHALKNYMKANNKGKLQFCLLWANHDLAPQNLKDFDEMVMFWEVNYFNQPTYYRIDGKPVVFIFSVGQLEMNAKKFGEYASTLLARANASVKAKGYKGIYFISTTNERPSDIVEKWLYDTGFSAYTGWNYVETKGSKTEDYDVMVNGYLDYYNAAAQTSKRLLYIVPASPGWDSRPWHGKSAVVRTNPTPAKFERMLRGAKQLMDTKVTTPKILMIEAWNEFGEGSYIEPTKKWGLAYLESIKKIYSPSTATAPNK